MEHPIKANEDPLSKARLEEAEKLYYSQNQARSKITQEIMDKKMDTYKIASELEYGYHRYPCQFLGWGRMEMQYLQGALHTIYGLKNPIHGKANRLQSPVEEIDDHIASLNNQMQHGCHTLAKEKQLLRDLKQAEADKQEITSNAAMNLMIPRNFRSVEAIKDRIKQLSVELEELNPKELERRAKRKSLPRELEGLKRDIRRLQRNLAVINKKKDAAYKLIIELRRQKDERISLVLS